MKSAYATQPRSMPTLDNVALFMDFDGTIVSSSPKPGNVVVPRPTIDLLTSLQKKTGGALAIVSGRQITSLDNMLAPMSFLASGCLGAEMRLKPDGNIHALAEPIPINVVHELYALTAWVPGVVFENKMYSACFHFGTSIHMRHLLEQELSALPSNIRKGIKIIYTEHSCEIKKHSLNKGSAIRNFYLTPNFKNKIPIYIGNDILDREAFLAVRAMGGLGLYVGDRYIPPEADFALKSVQDVHKWLERI